ncbi:hypothetical protein [Streptomyces milbemycinicus]|uniref:Uncharacterized protein n=1 Tax=Streptomyces milbemycinicus TaxID=476552 RepID=A0ABW8LVN7_9ACTN
MTLQNHATKKTSPDGFHLHITVGVTNFQATDTLTTTADGHTYHPTRQRNLTSTYAC